MLHPRSCIIKTETLFQNRKEVRNEKNKLIRKIHGNSDERDDASYIISPYDIC